MLELLVLPERLKYVRIVGIKDYSDRLTSRLQELGFIHVEELKEVLEEDLQKLRRTQNMLEELNTSLRFVEGFISTPKLVEVRFDIDFGDLEEGLAKMYSSIRGIKEGVETLIKNIDKLNEVRTYNELLIKYLGSIPDEFRRLSLTDLNYDGELFFSRLIRVKSSVVDEVLGRLKEVEVIFTTRLDDGEVLLYVLGLKGSLQLLNDVIGRAGCEVIDLPKVSIEVSKYLEKLKADLLDVEKRVQELKSAMMKLLESNLELIAFSKLAYEAYKERVEVLLNSLSTNYCLVIEGWVPEGNYPLLKEALSREFRYILVEDVITSRKEPPTKLRNKGMYENFELITKLYGIPRYNEWDPTRLITYSFMVFFGLMLADVVYGIALIFITKYLLDRLGFVDNPYSEGYLNLKRVLVVLGFSSTLFGFLSNTYAGYSIQYIQSVIGLTDPLEFIKLALIIGLLHVNLAHTLAVVRSIKSRDRSTLLSEVGLLLAEISALPYILWYFLKVSLLPVPHEVYVYLLYAAFVGLAVLVTGKYMALGSLGLFLWLFDVTGILGDVFSYTRIAGIGLATYLMARSFNDLALMVFNVLQHVITLPLISSILAFITSLIVVLLTNIINVTFGIIGSFVHSLRLCFVEFLPKFYEGGGREFKPLKVPTIRYVLVGFKPL